MLTDTMMPEACERAHDFAGLVTVAVFSPPSSSGNLVDERH
jgi:hypothetical protein